MARTNGTSEPAGADSARPGSVSGPRAERNPLPAGVMPRGLSRVQSAAYVGVSPTLFDRAVADGKVHKPFRLYGRVLWDQRQLDADIDAMAGTEISADDPWAKMAL